MLKKLLSTAFLSGVLLIGASKTAVAGKYVIDEKFFKSNAYTKCYQLAVAAETVNQAVLLPIVFPQFGSADNVCKLAAVSVAGYLQIYWFHDNKTAEASKISDQIAKFFSYECSAPDVFSQVVFPQLEQECQAAGVNDEITHIPTAPKRSKHHRKHKKYHRSYRRRSRKHKYPIDYR